jgi:hypothetical protein
MFSLEALVKVVICGRLLEAIYTPHSMYRNFTFRYFARKLEFLD